MVDRVADGEDPNIERIRAGLDHIGKQTALMSATARRYSEDNGGPETPEGEVWAWLSTLSDLVTQLSGWVDEVLDNGGGE